MVRMSTPRKKPLGTRNIVGAKVAQLRVKKDIKQKDFVAILQSSGMDITESRFSRLEGQERFVADYEVPILAKALGVSVEWLLDQDQEP